MDEPQKVTLDSIDNLIDVPEVSEHAIDAQKIRDAKDLDELKLHDSSGTGFDPAKHATDSDNNPLITKLGRYRKLTRKKGNTGSKAVSTVGLLTDKQDNKATPKANYLALGGIAASMTFTIGTIIGGDEWRPITDKSTGEDEKQMLSTAYGDYFEHVGIEDIPPGAALAMALISYASRRVTMPKTQSRYNKFTGWISRIFKTKSENEEEKK